MKNNVTDFFLVLSHRQRFATQSKNDCFIIWMGDRYTDEEGVSTVIHPSDPWLHANWSKISLQELTKETLSCDEIVYTN